MKLKGIKIVALFGFAALLLTTLIVAAIAIREEGYAIWPICRPYWMAPQQFKSSAIFCPGPLGYSISVDVTKPGEEVGISFFAWKQNEVTLPGPIEFKLVKINVVGRAIKVISQESREATPITPERVSWYTRVLNVAPANYRLSVVLRDENGDVFGKLMSTLYVPPQQLNASISLNRTEFRRGGTLELTIRNKGPTSLLFGSINWGDYTVEYLYPDGEWRRAAELWWPPLGGGPLMLLRPGKSLTQSIEVPSVPAGTYRISKVLSAEGTDISISLTETFTVIALPGT